MVDRKPARYLAPVALVVTVVGVYLIVQHNSTSHAAHTTAAQHAPRSSVKPKYAGQQFYVVQPGDILSKISQKTGVSVTTLEALNPNIAPNSLQVGQRIRLRR